MKRRDARGMRGLPHPDFGRQVQLARVLPRPHIGRQAADIIIVINTPPHGVQHLRGT
jgi:hypothetical protein